MLFMLKYSCYFIFIYYDVIFFLENLWVDVFINVRDWLVKDRDWCDMVEDRILVIKVRIK